MDSGGGDGDSAHVPILATTTYLLIHVQNAACTVIVRAVIQLISNPLLQQPLYCVDHSPQSKSVYNHNP